jgi:hypothetical protein
MQIPRAPWPLGRRIHRLGGPSPQFQRSLAVVAIHGRTIDLATRRSRRSGAPGATPDDRDCPGAHRRPARAAVFVRLGKRSSPGSAPTSWFLRTKSSSVVAGARRRQDCSCFVDAEVWLRLIRLLRFLQTGGVLDVRADFLFDGVGAWRSPHNEQTPGIWVALAAWWTTPRHRPGQERRRSETEED